MGQQRVAVGKGRMIVMGNDPPMGTWFAQLWDPEFDDDFEFGAPAKAVGYHETEQQIPPLAGEYGPYPVVSLDALVAYISQVWGITLAEQAVERIRRAEA